MKTVAYIFLFVLVFAVSLVVLTPLSFVVGMTKPPGDIVRYQHVSGTVWNGQINNLVVAGQPVGDVSITNSPMKLLLGQLEYAFTFNGAIGNGKGVARLGLDRGVALESVIADINVQNLQRLDPRLRSMPSFVNVGLTEGRWNNVGECIGLNGNLNTDMLAAVGRAFNWEGPDLSGDLRCEGVDTVVELAGSTAVDEISAMGRISGSGRYSVKANVTTQDNVIASALETLKFRRLEENQFEYVKTNAAQAAVEDKA